MPPLRVSPAAGQRLDEIFTYTQATWGQAQAEAYIHSLFDCFSQIAAREIPWRSIPAGFGVDGYYFRHQHHYIYWRILPDGAIGIVTILHERMHRSDRFREDERN